MNNFLYIGMILSLLLVGCVFDQLGGNVEGEPQGMNQAWSSEAKQLIEAAYRGIDATQLMDYHVHVVGVGAGNTGLFVNERMRSWWHIKDYVRFKIYLSASGITSLKDADQAYVARLVQLIRHMPQHGQYVILAFDKHYREDGSVDLDKTEFYVPNAYIVDLANTYPDLFVPAVSIHPYRVDALTALAHWAGQGVKYIKWLPNAMGMDPASPRLKPFYEMMQKNGMVLISHTGEEKAVESEENQRLGNPLLLRYPLSLGVKVMMAHNASLGLCADLDDGNKKVPCFDLAIRLLKNPDYKDLIFGDISAQLQWNHLSYPLMEVMKNESWHAQMVNGSDYPLPAINVLTDLSDLVDLTLISKEQAEFLREIYAYNPLLFDFVLKRSLRFEGKKLADQLFMRHPALP